MDKNDKLHNGTAPELNEEQLDSVSGGWETGIITGYIDDYCETCKKTTSHSFQRISELNPWDQKKTCTVCKTWHVISPWGPRDFPWGPT